MISKRIPGGDWEGIISKIRQRTSEVKEIIRDSVDILFSGNSMAFNTREILSMFVGLCFHVLKDFY